MKRVLLCTLFLALCSVVGFGQTDTSRRSAPEPSSRPQVIIPGVDAPMSGPGTLLQSSPNPNTLPAAQPGDKKRKTAPPTDQKAFGVGIPLGKAKKDTLRR